MATATKKVSQAKAKKTSKKNSAAHSKASAAKSTTKKVKKNPTAKRVVAKAVHKNTAKKSSAAKSVKKTKVHTNKVAKKSPLKRRVPVVRVAEPGQCFWVNYGPVINSLDDLASALHDMDGDQYGHHTGGERNDFARWVEDVFGESMLARRLERAKSQQGAYRVVVSHVSLYR